MEAAVVAVAILVLVLIVGGVVLFRRGRLNFRDQSKPKASSPGAPPGPLLVPLPNGRPEALLIGSKSQLATLSSSDLIRPSRGPSKGPIPQVVRSVIAVGGGGSTLKAIKAIESSQIVEITAKSMEALRKGKPVVDKAGETLGMVRGQKGFTHVMRLSETGPKALMASNAATLAMTAAVSQQLGQIEKQLEEISATLNALKIRDESDRLGGIKAANEELGSIAQEIERRGFMSESDQDRVAALSLDVRQRFHTADLQLERMLRKAPESELSRRERVEALGEVKEDLDLWLQLWVEAEMAYTRRDVLHLYWEQSQHPETARALADKMHQAALGRRRRMHEFGDLLDRLLDPSSQTRLDPLRQFSRWSLTRQREVKAVLAKHQTAFAGPDADAYSTIESGADEVLELGMGVSE